MSVLSLYVEKKAAFAVEASGVLADLRAALGLWGLKGIRLINRYLIEGLSQDDLAAVRDRLLSEPPLDLAYDDLPDFGGNLVFAVEYLPGQFDQRADSCVQCISLLTGGKNPTVRCAKIWVLEGTLTDSEFAAVKSHLVNPIESREAGLNIPASLQTDYPIPEDVPAVAGFLSMDASGLAMLLGELGLAMDTADLTFCQTYFREQGRDPTLTELRVLDTYWSDHCRHTTFLTELNEIETQPDYIAKSLGRYNAMRAGLGREKAPVTLMDMATIAARSLKALGVLNRLDESGEINACSVNVRVNVGGLDEDWLVMFKNETHNHPTEIEPFGGAATCLGGAIRDPLSGRSYVYQAMRLSGAASPLTPASQTRPGKLSQKKICQTAAAGYSSYGNQIGLATGLVNEIYHSGYEAKRMEMGAVIGAVPAHGVIRVPPMPGDKVILLGGKTGRDGCGGATGSSKAHTADSLERCGAEVQKGNPPEERKIQRLFRNPYARGLIKRCNDFGAGGVSVAIGELADGLEINLDCIPLKYEGLDGTELAISESQERMAVVVGANDAEAFIALAGQENLEATEVAQVTQAKKLIMRWRGQNILELDRAFLDSNGAPRSARAFIPSPRKREEVNTPVNRQTLLDKLSDLAFASQKGLAERFDSTVGAGSVLLPFGGKYQLTPAQVMAAKLPAGERDTLACTLMSWAYNPEYSAWSPYHGAMCAVIESAAKILAAGGSRTKCWLTFQEYYEKLGDDPERWGKPAAALLGALEAQMQLQIAAIGGKDSMSGSFEGLNVPPTLVSMAVGLASADRVISGEFKQTGSHVYYLTPSQTDQGLPDFDDVRFIFDLCEQLIQGGRVLAAWAAGFGGSAEGVFKMCLGNRIGFRAVKDLSWNSTPGGFILEASEPLEHLDHCLIGKTIEPYKLELPEETVDLAEVQAAWESTLAPIYPEKIAQTGPCSPLDWDRREPSPALRIGGKSGKPLVVIPVFPGTNCEYDTARAFERAGANTEIFVVRNLTPGQAADSAKAFAELVERSKIVAIPGGFSAGDEPEGSAKFITSFLWGDVVREKIEELLQARDGLMLGICNGFQALIKLGLVPFGEYRQPTPESPTLSCNVIGRHQSRMVRTRIASNKSPWLSGMRTGDVYLSPVSHGEGRFIAEEKLIAQLAENGQVATQYVDFDGSPTMDIAHNPNGSAYAIEGITSPDGRVFGKMAHNERYGEGLYRNIPPHGALDIFKCAVDYYMK
ncbi:MAG: phosphoribosylformylglycinamidine synthase [Oscillospiraceae bacterium]|nr:phosphoribosylformylglycinamidine synthase [Oscillospiraceae bacterium]